jgi:DNA-binding transcriptional ArsR family regulator
MKTEVEEFVDIDTIAERFGVHHRTIERLIEEYARKLKKSRRRQGRKILYRWADILKVAKHHTGVEKEHIPSRAIKRAYTKQRIKELEAEVALLTQERDNRLKSKQME